MIAPFDLNLRHLRAVVAMAELHSISAAAGAANLSQPALTQGLLKLERQLGALLFERRADGVVATPHGVIVADRVRAATNQLARGARSGRTGRGFSRPEGLMTATQLRAFLALADAGSFVGAGKAAGLSQPAIHRAVRDLEQVIGLPLAERRDRGIMLSAHGRRLARGIRLASGEIAALIAELQAQAEEGGRIVVGAMPLSRAHLLPAAITAILQAAPLAAIDVVEGSWRELVEPLRDGVIDLMVGALRDPVPAGLEQTTLSVDRLAIVARADHPLAGTDPDSGVLARYPWVVGRDGTPLRDYWNAFFGAALPRAPVECGSVMIIRGLLIAGDFLTLLSPDQIALELQGGVLTIIGPPLMGATRTIGITTRSDWRPTRMQQRFIDLLRAEAALPKIE